MHADRVAIDHQVGDDALDVGLSILEPNLAAAGRQGYAMTADLLSVDLDAGDGQADVEPLQPIFGASLRVRYRQLPDQIVDWLAPSFARRSLREIAAASFIEDDMHRRMRDRPSLDNILTPQQSQEADVHGGPIDVGKRRNVVGSDRPERHVLEDHREVEQVVVESSSGEGDL